MTVVHVASASTKRDAIRAVYAAVNAPNWASPNLDGLLDILRDLSWLPPGPVVVHWPATSLPAADARAIDEVLDLAQDETAESDRPVRVVRAR